MKLLTQDLLKQLPALGTTDGNLDAPVVCKFFDPTGSWTWYVLEYDPKDRLFFGLVDGFEKELGYFSLDELQSVKGRFGLGIERDLHWQPITKRELLGMARED